MTIYRSSILDRLRFLTIALISVLSLAVSGLTVRAEELTEEKKAAIQKFIEVSGAKEQGQVMLEKFLNEYVNMLKEQQTALSPEIYDILVEESKNFVRERVLDNPEYWELNYAILHKYYTLDDMNGLIAFYETPLGHKLVATGPLIAGETMQAAGEQIMAQMTEFQRRIIARMKEYKLFRLPDELKNIIMEQIKGETTLSKDICDNVDVKQGAIYAYLPKITDVAKIKELRWGGLANNDITIPHIVGIVHKYLLSGPNKYVICENKYIKRGDSYLRGSRVVYHGDEAYYYLSGQDNDSGFIRDVLLDANFSMEDYFYFISLPDKIDLTPGASIDIDTIAKMARGIEAIGRNAFDAEGYVVWDLKGGLME